MDECVSAIRLRADMSQEEIKQQLLKRREIMMARTKARAEARKQKKLAAKKKEQEAAMAPEVKKKSLALASMRAMVNQANKALKNNENKVSYLEAEAKQQHQIELKKAQEDKAAEKHRRLQARLEKKKQAKMGAKK